MYPTFHGLNEKAVRCDARSASPAPAVRERWILGAVAVAALAVIAVWPLRPEAAHLLTVARYVLELFQR